MDEPLPPSLSVPSHDLLDAERRRREELRRMDLERELRQSRRELDRRAMETNRELERRVRDMGRYGTKRAPGLDTAGGGAASMELERAVGIAGIVLSVPILLVLLTGHVSALVFDGAFPRYPLAEVPQILVRLFENLGDPGRAWDPVNTGGRPPGPVAWWSTFLALVIPAGIGGWYVLDWLKEEDERNQFATWKDIRHLRPTRGARHQLVVGTAQKRRIVVHDLHSLMLVGPAHSGKSSCVVVPALLEWEGPAIVASSKGHVVHETIGWRSHQGEVHVFDPNAVTPYARSGWSPLATCTTWAGAIRTARDLTLAAKASVGAEADTGDLTGIVHSDLWSSAMATAVAPYLLAATHSNRTIVQAAEWIEREEREEVLDILRPIDRDAARAHESMFVRNDPVRSQFFHVMYQILSVYKDPVAAASADRHDIIPEEFLDGDAHTLYLVAPEYDQARFRPLNTTIIRQILTAVYDRATVKGHPLDPPLLLLLDGAVGVAPMNELAQLASTAAARGVQLVSVFQDFRQIEDEYGGSAGLVLKNHRAKLLLSGSQYIESARDDRQLLKPKLGEHLDEDEGALFYGNSPPVRLKLRPWYKDRELVKRAETPMDSLPPPDPARSRSIDDRQNAQVTAWLARHPRPEDDTDEFPTRGRLGRADPTRSLSELLGRHDDDKTMPENVTRLSPFRRGDRHRDR
ncbi:MAG TPA: type IV secretory system conjugative DNA transfer family protein [Acidimicrobiales bacterium]